MGRKLYDFFASLNLGLWLIGGVLALLAAGSFMGGEERGAINNMPLFRWLTETPASSSWWLWAAIGLLAVLALNTVLCSIDSIRNKYGSTRFLILIAPQVMHAGFLLIVLAHFFSAWGGDKQVLALQEGKVIGFADGSRLRLAGVTAVIGPRGVPVDYSAEIRIADGSGESGQVIRPNQPFFYRGSGFYLKEVAPEPYRAALIEIHREPGAGAALAGAILFTIGNIVLLAMRRGRSG